MVTKGQALNLKNDLEQFILTEGISVPLKNEAEVGYTGRVLLPLVEQYCSAKFDKNSVIVRGDGAKLKAPVVSLLGGKFNPDISIQEHEKRVWAGEVKLLDHSELSSTIAKALGQTLIYSQSYLAVSCLIVLTNSRKFQHSSVIQVSENINILLLTSDLFRTQQN